MTLRRGLWAASLILWGLSAAAATIIDDTDRLLVPAGETYTLQGNRTYVLSIEIQGTVLVAPLAAGLSSGSLELSAPQVIVTSGGRLSADGAGYGPGAGPGAGQNEEFGQGGRSGGGGGYGGQGGQGTRPGGLPYGSLAQPLDLGSGGGGILNRGGLVVPGGNGGGGLKISAQTLRLDGSVSANGAAGAASDFWGDWAGGGAGGSVLITAQRLEGSGVISASGGASTPRSDRRNGGGGGGGRILVSFDASEFAGTITARGGLGLFHGGAGTVVYGTELRVDNGVSGGNTTILSGSYSFDRVLISSYAILEFNAGVSLNAGSLLVRGNSTFTNRGSVTLSASAVAEQAAVLRQSGGTLSAQRLEARSGGLLSHDGGMLSAQEAEVGSGGVLSINTRLELPRLRVMSGGLVTHSLGDADFDLVTTETLTVETGGRISADGAGYGPGAGPGAGQNEEFGQGGRYGGGGGHGGQGGQGTRPGGLTYGSLAQPLDLGSGGGGILDRGNLVVPGGRGGGRLKISAQTLKVDGSVSAAGAAGDANGFWGDGAGGGAGGSVLITAQQLEGSGMISANGGASSPREFKNGGGGGGGRVVIVYGTSLFIGTITARGGLGGQFGGAGTIVYGSELRIDNGVSGGSTTILSGSYSFERVLISSRAILEFDVGVSLSASLLLVQGNSIFTNRGNVTLSAAAVAEQEAVLRQSAGTLSAQRLEARSGGLLSHDGGMLSAQEAEVGSGGVLSINTRLELPRLRVMSGGFVTHASGDADFDLAVAETLIVETGGRISANGAGYGPGAGPGAGQNEEFGQGGRSGGGGGYGGQGGQGTRPGGFPYGSLAQPLDLGSGGGGILSRGNTVVPGGNGGGRLKISAQTLRVDGSVSADGAAGAANGFWGDGAGGGAGGSVLITAQQLEGSGVISANGGASSPRGFKNGGGGGGGRIALYYTTKTGSQILASKGGLGFQNGSQGTIIDNGVLSGSVSGSSATLAFSQMQEGLASSETLNETLSAQLLDFAAATSTGVPAGAFSLAEMSLVLVKTGPFKDKGFFRGRWTLTVPSGESLSGEWEGMAFLSSDEPQRLVLKGILKGRIQGMLEGSLAQSVAGSGVFDRLTASCRLIQVGAAVGASAIYISGTGSLRQSAQYPGTSLSFLQTSQVGEVSGYYSTSLDVAFSLLRVNSAGHPYQGEGFFTSFYNSSQGSGEGWAYAAALGDGARLSGLFGQPLEGLMEGMLTLGSPRSLLLTLQNLDVGLPLQADISASLAIPGNVPVGGVATVVVELRNDGYDSAPAVTVVAVAPESSGLISATGDYKSYNVTHWRGSEYAPRPFVRWDLTSVPARSSQKMSYQVRMPPGTQESIKVDIDVHTVPTSWADQVFANYEQRGAP